MPAESWLTCLRSVTAIRSLLAPEMDQWVSEAMDLRRQETEQEVGPLTAGDSLLQLEPGVSVTAGRMSPLVESWRLGAVTTTVCRNLERLKGAGPGGFWWAGCPHTNEAQCVRINQEKVAKPGGEGDTNLPEVLSCSCLQPWTNWVHPKRGLEMKKGDREVREA